MIPKKAAAPPAQGQTPKPAGSPCHGAQMCLEPLFLVGRSGTDEPAKTRFGHVKLCTNCQRPCGDYVVGTGAPSDFNASSWATMMRVHPWPPYGFERRAGISCLVPEGYQGEQSE